MDVFLLTRTMGDLQVNNKRPRISRLSFPERIGRAHIIEAKGPYRRYSDQAPATSNRSNRAISPTSACLDEANPFSGAVNQWYEAMAAGRKLASRIESAKGKAPGTWTRHDWDTFCDWQIDHLKKLTLQRSRRPFWYLEEQIFSNTQSDPPAYHTAVSALSDYLKHEAREADAHGHGYTRGSNHGWPDMLSDDVSLLVHATVAGEYVRRHPKGTSIPEAAAALREIVTEIGVPTPFGITVFSRAGPRVKPLPVTEVDSNGGLWKLGESEGMFPRTRLVFGVSTWLNLIGFQMYPALIAGIKALNLWHDAHHTVASDFNQLRGRFKYVYNDDISSYDHSFTLERLAGFAALEDQLAARFSLRPSGSELYTIETLPLLTPGDRPLHLAVTPRQGGLCSGRIDTTFIGCMGNVVRLLLTLHSLFPSRFRLDRDTIRRIVDGSGDVCIRVWGDDTIIFSNLVINQNEWNAACEESSGCSTELNEGAVFLMQYLSPTGDMLPSVGRQFQQRVANEHPYAGPMAVRSSCINAVEICKNNPFRGALAEALTALYPSALTPLSDEEQRELLREYGGAARAELEEILRREGAPSLQLEWAQEILARLPPEPALDLKRSPASYKEALRFFQGCYTPKVG